MHLQPPTTEEIPHWLSQVTLCDGLVSEPPGQEPQDLRLLARHSVGVIGWCGSKRVAFSQMLSKSAHNAATVPRPLTTALADTALAACRSVVAVGECAEVVGELG